MDPKPGEKHYFPGRHSDVLNLSLKKKTNITKLPLEWKVPYVEYWFLSLKFIFFIIYFSRSLTVDKDGQTILVPTLLLVIPNMGSMWLFCCGFFSSHVWLIDDYISRAPSMWIAASVSTVTWIWIYSLQFKLRTVLSSYRHTFNYFISICRTLHSLPFVTSC